MDDFYSVNQVSIILKVHPLTIRRYIKEGRLKAVRVGGAVRVAKSYLDAFVKSFNPHDRGQKTSSRPAPFIKPFDAYDPIFRLRARGANG